MGSGPSLRRRALLAGTAGAVATTSGCIGEIRNLAGRQRTRQLSLTIATMPAASDPYAVRIANQLADNLQLAGIETFIDPMSPEVLFREVLINHDFDVYVARYPMGPDPDELRSLLHSRFAEEGGWQNPFGFSNLDIDELLDQQRVVDADARVDLIQEIQSYTVREQPFTVVGFADRISASREDRFDRWPPGGPQRLTDYLALERIDDETARLLLRDDRATRNLNPIAAEHRDPSDVTGLLYEPLVRHTRSDSESIPWLARSVEWGDTDSSVVTVTLREASWHDGTPVTASDVAFTYEFLQDTSLGEFETPVPTPWRRGRVSLVERATAPSNDVARLKLSTTSDDVARRVLSVPILPEHVWHERSESAEVGPIDLVGQTTEALVTANESPIGSGPFEFVEATPDEELVLESFSDHFLYRGDTDGIPERLTTPPFERTRFEVVPSHDAAAELLETGDADAVADGLQASVVPRIIRSDDVSLSVARSAEFYHVGYNCRAAPMSNPRFRRTIAQLLDREHLVSTSFGGYAVASELPVTGQWAPEELQWDGTASLPFLGEDGELDVSAAMETFSEAGYQYENGRLVRRGDS